MSRVCDCICSLFLVQTLSFTCTLMHYWILYAAVQPDTYNKFMQDAQDAFLEQERDRVLTKKLLLMQKAIRGWHYRRKFQKMQTSCVTLQTYMRGFLCQLKFRQVTCVTCWLQPFKWFSPAPQCERHWATLQQMLWLQVVISQTYGDAKTLQRGRPARCTSLDQLTNWHLEMQTP